MPTQHTHTQTHGTRCRIRQKGSLPHSPSATARDEERRERRHRQTRPQRGQTCYWWGKATGLWRGRGRILHPSSGGEGGEKNTGYAEEGKRPHMRDTDGTYASRGYEETEKGFRVRKCCRIYGQWCRRAFWFSCSVRIILGFGGASDLRMDRPSLAINRSSNREKNIRENRIRRRKSFFV